MEPLVSPLYPTGRRPWARDAPIGTVPAPSSRATPFLGYSASHSESRPLLLPSLSLTPSRPSVFRAHFALFQGGVRVGGEGEGRWEICPACVRARIFP